MAHTEAGNPGVGPEAGEPAAFAVGVATYNQAQTVGALLQAVEGGLAAALPGRPVVVIHADGGSQDGTLERAREASTGLLIQVSFALDQLARPGTGLVRPAALRAILGEAGKLGTGCAVLDAEAGSLPSGWIERLARPVLADQMDFVAPCYLRHPLDGTITSGIAFPLQRALYGKGLRFPLATDFACSGRFISALLEAGEWPAELSRVGSEAWLVTRAVTGDFRICQALLGAKDTTGAEGGSDLGLVLPRILGALFLEMERHVAAWQKVRGAAPVPVCGGGALPSGEPKPVGVDVKRALDSYRLGQRNLLEVWRLVLSPAALLELAKLAQRTDQEFRFPDTLWARTVYDFALAHHFRVMNRDHLLAAFVPLYLGWLGSFAGELGDADPARTEPRIEELCLRYESEKPYLISRWRWPDRFNP